MAGIPYVPFRKVGKLLRKTFDEWNEHEAQRLGAALAFYTLLSLAPLVIFVIAIVALIIGHTAAQGQLLSQARSLVGPQGEDALKGVLDHVQKPAPGIIASLTALVTLLFGASGVFGELRAALHKMWNVKVQYGNEVSGLVKEKIFSFGMVLAIGFLLLVSLVVSAALAATEKFFGGFLPISQSLLDLVNFLISWVGIAALFALIFRYVPAIRIAWESIWVGAAVTALLFTVGKALIAFYLGVAAVGSAYGAAGSLIAVIVWVYYSSMIFLFGAEFTHVLSTERRPRAAS